MTNPVAMLRNRFGHFDPSGHAFVITDPATPMPWVNVICNGRYGLVVSQNGGGFSWLDDSQHNVLTRWQMDLVQDGYGKFLYLADLDTSEIWSATPAPCQPRFDEYSCTHSPGATIFVTRAHAVRTSWTLAVAPDDNVEIWLLRITNTGDTPRRLRLCSYLEWCCGVAPDSKREFHRLFFSTAHDPARRAILATKNMWDIPNKSEKDHWNRPWPYAAAHAVCGFTFERNLAIANKATFLKRYGSTASPRAMTGPIGEPSGFGRFSDACAAIGGDFTLGPGQTASLHYLLAIDESEEAVSALLDKYRNPIAAQSAVAQATREWETRLSPTHVESSRPDFDILNNTWLTYQSISGRLWGRTGYYQQSGARGFRDQLQDSQVWLPLEPSNTLDQLMLHATRQFADGSVNHWWHALADFGNHTACSDDYLWLPFVTASYLRETGDLGALSRSAPFMDDPRPATLREHCKRSFDRAFARMSPRGLPHIGSCDWNDGLSAMGVDEKGESVWLAMFLCQLLADWTVILERVGELQQAEKYRARRTALALAINTHAWDGAWYRYGTKDDGEWIGASRCAEGRIHLNAQTWALLADIAPRDRADAAWNSVREHLLSPYGPLLLAPAYTNPDPSVGYITRYSPGSRENGGVYMHAATWALAAAAKVRDAAAVQSIWDSISPAWRGRDAESYWAEPYVTPGNVDGPLSDLPGRAGWTWYTGSAAWLNRVSLEWVLGIRPTWQGLLIDPVPPASLGRVRARRVWRGVPITVIFDAAEFAPGRRARVLVDGRELDGGVVPASMVESESRGVEVEVTWSQPPAGKLGAPAGIGKATA
ncbi:cellobiose phosphorylase [Phycisphaerales bacterium]|nr:cellobiose phosphorylase [Phycisphaerales bacterium]